MAGIGRVKSRTRLGRGDEAHSTLMSLRLVSPAKARSMRWRNGGGSTLEIATGPAAATLDDFAWRASIATIERDGPFSVFPGVDRTLVLLAGDGMRLTIAGRDVVLGVPYAAVSFRGDDAAACTLLGGATRDFNFMWRRAAGAGQVQVITQACRLGPADTVVCHAAQASWTCARDGEAETTLAPGHTWVAEGAPREGRPVSLAPCSEGAVAIVATLRSRAS